VLFKHLISIHIGVGKVTGSTPSVEEVLAISKHCVQQVRSPLTLFACSKLIDLLHWVRVSLLISLVIYLLFLSPFFTRWFLYLAARN
jgi:hypothetical protein